MTAEEEEGGGGGGGKVAAVERKEQQQHEQPPEAQQQQKQQPTTPPSYPAPVTVAVPPSTPPPAQPAVAVYNLYPHRLPRFYPPAVPSPYNAYPAFYPLYPTKQPYAVSPSAQHSAAAATHFHAAAQQPPSTHTSTSQQRKSRKSRRSRRGGTSGHHTHTATGGGGEDEDSESSDDSDDEEEEEEGQPTSRRPSLALAQPQTAAHLGGHSEAPDGHSHTAAAATAAVRHNTNNNDGSDVRAQQTAYPPPPLPHYTATLPAYHPYYQTAMAHTLPAAHHVPNSHTLRAPHISPALQPLANGEMRGGGMAYEHAGGDAYDELATAGELYTLPTAASVQQQQYIYQHHPYFYHQPQHVEQQQWQQPPAADSRQRYAATTAASPPHHAADETAATRSAVLRSPPVLHPSPHQQQVAVTSPSPHRQPSSESYQLGLQSPQSASSMSVSRTTQASPLSATSDLPDEVEEPLQAHANASLPTYSSAYQHVHHTAHKMPRSVDDWDVHLHNYPQAEPDSHQHQQHYHDQQPGDTQQQQHYHYAHTRTASDDLTHTLHSMQLHTLPQQQQQAALQQQQPFEAGGYDESVGAEGGAGVGQSVRPAVEYQHYHGAKGRVFRVRDITSSYAEGEDSRRGSRRSSYTVHASPISHPAYSHYLPPDSPHRYAGQHYIDNGGQPWEYAAVDTFHNGHIVPTAPLLSAHPAAHPFHRISTAPSASKKAKKHRKDEIHFADLRFGGKIGEGSFGEVFRGSLWGQEVAIKKLRIQAVDGAAVSREFKKEVKIMRTLRHPNIVEFLGVCMEPPNLCLVTEYLSNGSLEDVLTRIAAKSSAEDNSKEGTFTKKFSLKRIISLAKDIARGLNWLHHKGIIHRDLKSANILLDANGKAKICDFGLSHVKRRVDLSGSYGICGTPSYMAPEVLRKQSYGVKADVFSFGICLCELISGKYPYDSDNQSTRTFEDAIVCGLRPTIPAYCPLSIKHLIQSCWADDPDQRPSVDEIMDTLVLTERQLLAAENLTILDEMPEEIAKLFEDQKAENAFLAMSIKQLKGQLDAAQARASEWEEKFHEERSRREDAERAVKQLRDQLQQLTAAAGSLGAPSSSSPLLSMAVPVLMRGNSNAPMDGASGRRLSIGSLASVSRLSLGGSVAGVSGSGAASGGPTYASLPRPILHTGGGGSPQPTPLVSPSNTPSPTHMHGGFAAALVAATPSLTAASSAGHSFGQQPSTSATGSHPLLYHHAHAHTHTHVPPAAFLSPAHSAPLTTGTFTSGSSPPASMQQGGSSPTSPATNRSPSPTSTSPRQREGVMIT